MIRWITLDDFIETYTKLHQRGTGFIGSKFNLNKTKRAKTAFNHIKIQAANWWIIPKVKQRWLERITGDPKVSIEEFTVSRFLKNKQNLTMLSLGSGECATELIFAKYPNFKQITCTDIAEKRLDIGKKSAEKQNLTNIIFKIKDANKRVESEEKFDVVYFRASLHHFKSIDTLLGNQIKQLLKPDGLLIIDEYVGPSRLQFPKHQIKAINEAIKIIPKPLRQRYKLTWYKNKVSGPGLLRMIMADPSECVDSASIIPALRNHYETVYEVGYGGNILTLALKDIAQHFTISQPENDKILQHLFDYEDKYLKKHPSDHIFGIYKLN